MNIASVKNNLKDIILCSRKTNRRSLNKLRFRDQIIILDETIGLYIFNMKLSNNIQLFGIKYTNFSRLNKSCN